MKKIILIAIALMLVGGEVKAKDFDHEETCSFYKNIASKVNKEGPVWIDHATRSDGIFVSCTLKIVDLKKYVKLNHTNFRLGWQQRKQSQINKINCVGSVLKAITNGWTMRTTLTFQDGFMRIFDAKCNSGS
jgi:hypothetical protein